MSTDQMEAETESPETIPMTDSIEVGGDIDAAVAEEESEAQPESEKTEDPNPDDVATKLALSHLYDVQDRLDAAVSDHETKADVAKTAKKRVESLQEDLSLAVKKLRNAKAATEPDPSRYPLYDRAKADINAEFPAPDSIPPLPADNFEEFLRRKQRDTAVTSMGLKPGVVTYLDENGYKTAGDIVRRYQETTDRNMPLTSIKGMTEARIEAITEALGRLTDESVAEWETAHAADSDATDIVEAKEGGDDE